jgi:two-component sensor histidine kinase
MLLANHFPKLNLKMKTKKDRVFPISIYLIAIALFVCIGFSYFTILEIRSIALRTNIFKQNISNCTLSLSRLIFAATDLVNHIQSPDDGAFINKRIELSRALVSHAQIASRQLDASILSHFLLDDPLILGPRNKNFEAAYEKSLIEFRQLFSHIESASNYKTKLELIKSFESMTVELLELLEERSNILMQIEAHYFIFLRNSTDHLLYHLNIYLGILGGVTVLIIAVMFYYYKSRKRVIHDLKLHRDELEDEVKKRTAELSDSNIDLQTENTERIKAEKIIKENLIEKETLLQEIHHRVKNNMTVISSLLKLQMTNVADKKAKEALQDSQNRVQTMSMIHETLYQSDNLSAIDLKSYLTELGRNIFQNYLISSETQFKVEAENILISVKQASPIGLIVNELIANCLKYAFPDDRIGEILLELKSKNGKGVELAVSDNGVGIPESFDLKSTDSLGLKLVKILVENQLDGSIDMENKNGTKFTIKFNIET